jgi:chitodextrinase
VLFVTLALSWTASADNIGVTGYNIYRNGSGTPLNGTLLTATTYTDTGLTGSTAYTYQVQAYDAASNASGKAPSTPLSVTTACTSATCASNNCGSMSDGCGGTLNCGSCTTSGQYCASGGNGTANICGADTTPPTVPSGLTANTSVSTNSSLSFSWTASSDTINSDVGSGVNGYDVYRSTSSSGPFNAISTLGAQTVFKDTALVANTTYYYKLAAFDVAGNTSAQSSSLSMTTLNSSISNLSRQGWVATSMTYAQAPMAAIGVTTPGNSHFSMGASQANGQYWQVDMGSPQTFRQINIYTYSSTTRGFPTSFNVDVSDDNINWTRVVTNQVGLCTDSGQCTIGGSGALKLYPTSTPTTVSVSSMTHRYIRITLSCGSSGAPSCTGTPHGGFWNVGDGGDAAGNGVEVLN